MKKHTKEELHFVLPHCSKKNILTSMFHIFRYNFIQKWYCFMGMKQKIIIEKQVQTLNFLMLSPC